MAVLGGGPLGLLTAEAAARGGLRVVWLRSWSEPLASAPPARPPRWRPARAAAADAAVVALAAEGLAAWGALGDAGRSVDAPYSPLGCLDIAGRGESGDRLDAVAEAVRGAAGGGAGGLGGATSLAAGEAASLVRGLALPRGAGALWLPPEGSGGGILDSVAAAAAAQAAADRAGVALWPDAAAAGWRDKGSHFQVWAALEGSSGGEGGTAVLEAERLVLVPGPHALSEPGPPRPEDKAGGGEPTTVRVARLGCPRFGLSLTDATLRWPAWAVGARGAGSTPPGAPGGLPCVFCHGLAPGGDGPAGGGHEPWVALPTSSSTPPLVLRPPGAALVLPPWPSSDAVRADAAAAVTAAAAALGPGLLALSRGGGAGAAAAAGGGWAALETADGRPLLGWAPVGIGTALGREPGRVLLAAGASGGAAGGADALAAAPALARAAGRLLCGGGAAVAFDPARPGVGAVAGPSPLVDTWDGR